MKTIFLRLVLIIFSENLLCFTLTTNLFTHYY
jgi:hypothetical protein